MAETIHAGPSDRPPSSSGATILTHLSALLPTASPTQPYLHPYSPGASQSGYGWKGKARELYPSAEEQLRLIREVSAAVDGARTVLAKKDGDWAKLSRALREVATHQNALLPLDTSLLTSSSSLSSSAPPLPSPLVNLTPVELLQALAKQLDIQTYLEDSQFGLLKTTLTLAGNCFVVDVDLETDPSPGEDADVDVEAEADGADGAASMSEAGRAEGDARGKVRLSKLGVNHVTPGGGTGKSEHIAEVLKRGLVAYVEEWNKQVDGSDAGIRAERLEERIGRLRAMLEEIKVMDEMGHGAQETEKGAGAQAGAESSESRKDLFADLELVAKTVDGWIKGEDGITVHPSDATSVFPSFLTLPPTLSPGPVLHIRPARIGESVPPPPSATSEGGADITMEEARWLSAEWVLEAVPNDDGNGLVVRRSCFAPGSNGRAVGTWDGAAKVENMLYHDIASYPSGNPSPFPYTADFVHPSNAEAQKAEVSAPAPTPALEQHWSMAQPGPDAYILGRVGLPSSPEGLRNAVEALRKQAMLNCLFSEVFRPSNLANSQGSGEQPDGADDDWEDLMAEPTAIPLTVTQQEASLRITLPAPHIDAATNPPIVTLEVTPNGAGAGGVEVKVVFSASASSGSGTLSEEQERAVREALESVKAKGSLVELVRSLDSALRRS